MKTVVENSMTAAATSATTFAAGFATFLDLIPSNIGKLASLVGVFLSVVLITVQLRKSCIESATAKLKQQEIRLEILLLQKKKEAMEKGFKLRREENGINEHPK